MIPARTPLQLQHYVAGRRITSEPMRWITVPPGRDGTPEVLVPVATTADVDEFVDEIGRHLARWMARPACERRQAVTRLAETLIGFRSQIEQNASAYGLDASALVAQLHRSAEEILAIVERARADPAPPIGIAGFVIDSNRSGKLMLPMVAEVLVHGGVAIVASSALLAANSRRLAGVLAEALPPGVLNEVYGDQETADALTSNPLVAAIYVDGNDDKVDQLIRLAEVYRKPGVAYSR